MLQLAVVIKSTTSLKYVLLKTCNYKQFFKIKFGAKNFSRLFLEWQIIINCIEQKVVMNEHLVRKLSKKAPRVNGSSAWKRTGQRRGGRRGEHTQ